MRRWIAALAVIFFALAPCWAHVGSPDVYFQGLAGPYHLTVTIRTPAMIPGVAIGSLSPLVGARPFRRAPHTGFFAAEYVDRRVAPAANTRCTAGAMDGRARALGHGQRTARPTLSSGRLGRAAPRPDPDARPHGPDEGRSLLLPVRPLPHDDPSPCGRLRSALHLARGREGSQGGSQGSRRRYVRL